MDISKISEALTDRETSVEVHVQDWISRYEKNEGTAMLELINGILRVGIA